MRPFICCTGSGWVGSGSVGSAACVRVCAVVQVLKRVADYNSSRIRLAADMADDSQRVKVG